MTCSVLVAPGSRASVFLRYLRLQYCSNFVNFPSVKFCRLSFPKSLEWLPSPPNRFLIFCAWRASWLRIVAASGVNFSKSVAAGTEFCFSSESLASISSQSARSVSSCDRISTLIAIAPNFSFFPEPMQFFPSSQEVLHGSKSARSVLSCVRSSTNSCLSEAFSVLELPKSVCNPIFRVA